MARIHGVLIAGLLLTSSVAAACGEATPQVGALAVSSTAQVQGERTGAERRGPMGPMGLFADAALTDDQKAQVKAIAETYKPAQTPQNDVKTLLEAETVDEAALRAALQQADEARAKHQQDRWAMMSEIRAVYTDEQRAQVVTKLQDSPEPQARSTEGKAPRADFADRLAEKLQLNDEQKAAVAAIRPPAGAKPDFAAHKQAMITFWQTGDTSALQALPQPPHPDVDALVKAATVLTAEQRKAVFGRFAMGPGHGMGGPGGRGHGGHGGRGHGAGGPRPDGPPPTESV